MGATTKGACIVSDDKKEAWDHLQLIVEEFRDHPEAVSVNNIKWLAEEWLIMKQGVMDILNRWENL
jgi:hypothetical protein